MSNLLYRMYLAHKNIIAKAEEFSNEHGEEYKRLDELKSSLAILEEINPELLERFNKDQKMFASFTPEQKDFICYQIGDWYLMWQDKMWVEDKPNQHWLGVGKEHLKIMICGK